jgi:tRNA-dihydrouridine synthase B
MAGSALLRDESLVRRILESVVNAVTVPVTLKIRTGWDRKHRNGVTIARIAEQSGIQMLSVHGRTRACAFAGAAEHETVAAIKAAVAIPVVANGDITTPQQAAGILRDTGVDGIMIGRAAQGNPWIFRQIRHYLQTGEVQPAPQAAETCNTLLAHLQDLYDFYGEYLGVRIARKHIGWYCRHHPAISSVFRTLINSAESAREQLDLVRNHFSGQTEQELAA